MNIVQTRKLLVRIQQCEQEIAQLKKVRAEVAASGYASATIASANGSKSYTHQDLQKLTDMIAQLSSELEKLQAMLQAGGIGIPGKTVHVIYN